MVCGGGEALGSETASMVCVGGEALGSETIYVVWGGRGCRARDHLGGGGEYAGRGLLGQTSL